MFTGHFAIALGAAGRNARLPLGLLIGAAFAGDVTEAFVAAFNEPDPTRAWSHSLPATAIAGTALALVWRARGGAVGETITILSVALSHTFLDFLTGYKTLIPGLPPFGLQLYTLPLVDYALEVAAVLAGWRIWRSSLPPGARSNESAWSMLAMLLVAQTAVSAGAILLGPDLSPDGMSKFVR